MLTFDTLREIILSPGTLKGKYQLLQQAKFADPQSWHPPTVMQWVTEILSQMQDDEAKEGDPHDDFQPAELAAFLAAQYIQSHLLKSDEATIHREVKPLVEKLAAYPATLLPHLEKFIATAKSAKEEAITHYLLFKLISCMVEYGDNFAQWTTALLKLNPKFLATLRVDQKCKLIQKAASTKNDEALVFLIQLFNVPANSKFRHLNRDVSVLHLAAHSEKATRTLVKKDYHALAVVPDSVGNIPIFTALQYNHWTTVCFYLSEMNLMRSENISNFCKPKMAEGLKAAATNLHDFALVAKTPGALANLPRECLNAILSFLAPKLANCLEPLMIVSALQAAATQKPQAGSPPGSAFVNGVFAEWRKHQTAAAAVAKRPAEEKADDTPVDQAANKRQKMSEKSA